MNNRNNKSGGLSFVQAGSKELPSHLKLLIYGDSGSGKTWCSSTAPKPLVMLTERNGMQSIKRSNPDAYVAYCTTADQCRDFLVAVMNGDVPDGVETIVIDGITEVQQIMIDDILSKKGENRKMSLPDWGELGDRMRRFLRCLRDLPYHVVVTALVTHELNEESGETRVYPLVQSKKLPNQLAGYFNVVGFLFKRAVATEDGEQTVSRKIMLEGPSRFLCKPCEPLKGIKDVNLTEWVEEFVDSNSTKKSNKKGEK